ncbi:MAG: hypothetical protein ACKO96_07885 [Flammeovirgaceae bacterium]
MKETLRKSGYKYLKHLGNQQHLLLNTETNGKELFVSNKNHSSWGLIYKNTHLEFVSSIPANTQWRKTAKAD